MLDNTNGSGGGANVGAGSALPGASIVGINSNMTIGALGGLGTSQNIHAQLDNLKTIFDYLIRENFTLKTEKENLEKKCTHNPLSPSPSLYTHTSYLHHLKRYIKYPPFKKKFFVFFFFFIFLSFF